MANLTVDIAPVQSDDDNSASTPAGSVQEAQGSLSPEAASQELGRLFTSAPLSPKELAKPIWNRNTSTPQGSFRDPYPRNNYSPDGSYILAGQNPYGQPRPVQDLSPIPGARPIMNTTFDAPPRGPPINNATFDAPPRGPPINNATFNMNGSPQGAPYVNNATFNRSPGGAPPPPPPMSNRNSLNDPDRSAYKPRDASAYLDLGDSYFLSPSGYTPPGAPRLSDGSLPSMFGMTPPLLSSPELRDRFRRLVGESNSQPNQQQQTQPGPLNPPQQTQPGQLSPPQQTQPASNPSALPPGDDFLSLVNSYTNEMLKDFKDHMDKVLPPIVEEKVNELVDKLVTPEIINGTLDATLPKMADKALERLTYNAVELILKKALGEVTIETVLPLMTIGKIKCYKPCECFPEDCYKDFGPGDNPCAEFKLPPTQTGINRKFPPLINKAPGDPRKLDIPLPSNVDLRPRSRPVSRGRRPRNNRRYEDEEEEEEYDNEDPVCPCMERR